MIWLSMIIVGLVLALVLAIVVILGFISVCERIRKEVDQLEKIILVDEPWYRPEPTALIQRLQTIKLKLGEK